MAKRQKKEAKIPEVTTSQVPQQVVAPPSFPIQINILNQHEDGNVELEVNYSNEFREWFMQDQGLKRWSEKRFQQVVGPLLQEYYDNLAAKKATSDPTQVTAPENPEP